MRTFIRPCCTDVLIPSEDECFSLRKSHPSLTNGAPDIDHGDSINYFHSLRKKSLEIDVSSYFQKCLAVVGSSPPHHSDAPTFLVS